MSDYKIFEVQTRKDLMRFIKFPDVLYKDCAQYVPALHSDQVKSLTSVSTLKYCARKMWMVLDSGNKVVGRICGMINPRYNERYDKKCARFGWFDTINDIEVARLLLDTAEAWAKSQGMTQIHGPLYYNTLGKQGMLIEGYENIPPFNCIYNYPYYNELVQALGYEKECDWIQYKVVADAGVPEKAHRVASLLMEKYHLHEGNLDKLKKDKNMVKSFFQVYSDSFSNAVYNFIPFTEEEMEEEAGSYMKFISERNSSIILDENNAIAGFSVAFPSISIALQKAKGKLFPFGWYYLLKALNKYDTCDLMLNGAAPEWQNKGVSAVYHIAMSRKSMEAGCHWGITNPQIETNSAVNIWSSYEHELFMRRRCYIKDIR